MSESRFSTASVVAGASVAVNIFLVAFLLGHSTAFAPPPPPPPAHGMEGPPPEGGPGGPPPHGGPGADMPPPPPNADGSAPPPPPEGGPGMHHFGKPPMMGPGALFTPKEMEEDKPFIDAHFAKIHDLRKQFATRLEQGDISTAEIADHFKQVDVVMAELKAHFHQRAIAKISGMNPAQRKEFAKKLADY